MGTRVPTGIPHETTVVILEPAAVLGVFVAIWLVRISVGLRWRQN